MHVVNLAEKLSLFDETWTPKIVGELNGQLVKLAKLEGEYVWHRPSPRQSLTCRNRGTMPDAQGGLEYNRWTIGIC